MAESSHSALHDIATYYAQDREHDRLTRGLGPLEFLRTLDLLARLLPDTPATILDIGAGAGVYARELLRGGYAVHALDPMPGHVERLRTDPTLARLQSVHLGDARHLPFADDTADAAILLGPLYHLPAAPDRAQALTEAVRATRPGGRILAAAISRSSAILGDLMRDKLDEAYARPIRERAYRTGEYQNPEGRGGYFTTAYFHHPEELRMELEAAGLTEVTVYAVEGPTQVLSDPETALRDAPRREGIMRALRLIERDPALLGVSSHLLAVGVKSIY